MAQGARVLVARVGLDGHDRGTGAIARVLADAGYEVLLSAPGQTPQMVTSQAVAQAVDLLVLSMPSQSTTTLAPMVMKELRRQGAHVPVIVAGVVMDHDLPSLRHLGVAATFGHAPTARQIVEIVEHVLAPPILLAG